MYSILKERFQYSEDVRTADQTQSEKYAILKLTRLFTILADFNKTIVLMALIPFGFSNVPKFFQGI